MNNTITKILTIGAIAGTALTAFAQGAHSRGGGGGAGKVSVHDISINKNTNVLVAFDYGFRGGVRVAGGELGGHGRDVLLGGAGADRMGDEKTLYVMIGAGTPIGSVTDLVIDPFNSNRSKPKSWNSDKPMSWDNVKNAPFEVRIGFLRPDGKGKMEEYKTIKLKGQKIMQNAAGTFTLTFNGATIAPAISTGGTWYLKNANNPGTPILIGLLLPAVQKVR